MYVLPVGGSTYSTAVCTTMNMEPGITSRSDGVLYYALLGDRDIFALFMVPVPLFFMNIQHTEKYQYVQYTGMDRHTYSQHY